MKVFLAIFAFVAIVNAVDHNWTKLKPRNVYPKFPVRTVPGDGKIVGGFEATPHSIPYQVALSIKSASGDFFCGGSLISTTTVLTAAHCVDDAISVTVRLGAHDVSHVEDTQVLITSTKITVHEEWDYYDLINDIALIHLPEAAPINENIQVVQLPESDTNSYAGEIAKISGWGRDSDNAAGISSVLRYVNVPVTTNSECTDYFGSYITSGHVCTRGTDGVGGCNGDSGGPLVVSDGTQIGIVSFGSDYGCEYDYPTVFTRVSAYIDWIEINSGVSVRS